jgi:hypothetical protein
VELSKLTEQDKKRIYERGKWSFLICGSRTTHTAGKSVRWHENPGSGDGFLERRFVP